MSRLSRIDARLSAVVREKERQEREIARGDVAGALGYRQGIFPAIIIDLPRPIGRTEEGRVWSFPRP